MGAPLPGVPDCIELLFSLPQHSGRAGNGVIPAAAERLDQEHGTGHATSEDALTPVTSSTRAALCAVVTAGVACYAAAIAGEG